MATTMEQRAKFRELRLAGTSREDAMKQAYGSVAPVPPTANPPITPPTPTADPPQTMQGVNGEIFQIAPVNPQTGLSAPTQPVVQPTQPVQPATPTPAPVTPSTTSVTPTTTTPTPEVKPTPVKTEAPIDYNTSVGREAEIQKNVAEITKGNPALLKDRNAFNKAFGYDTADQGKKALLDSAFMGGNQPMDQKSVTQALISGASVPKQNTRAYNNAVVIADQYKRFNSMTPVQLLDNLKQGQIGTELDSLLSQNPNYVQAKAELAKAQKTASINRATAMAIGVISGKETPVVDDLKGIEAKYNPPLGANEQAYTNYVTNNPDVVSAGTQVKQLSNQISTLTTTYNDALKSIKAQYPDMSASALLTLMGSRTNETKTLLDSYINAKELAKGDFDLAMKMAEGHYTATAADIAQANILKNKQAELQMTADFQKKQAEQALNDPATAISSVIKEFTDMGIPTTQSLQTKIADAQKFIAQGGTLAGYIDKMRKDYMNKPEYKALSEYNKAKLAPKTDTSPYQAMSLGDGKAMLYNQTTGKYDVVNSSGISVGSVPNQTQIPSIVEECRTTGTCGQGVNDYLQKLGDSRIFGNSYSDKKAQINSQTPVVGGVAIWQPTGKMAQPEYGHVGIVSAVNGDQVTITDWNWNGDNKQSTHTVPLSSIQANGGGFYIPKGTGTQASQYTDSDIELLAELAGMEGSARNTALKAQGIPLKAVTDYMALAKAGKIPPTESQKQAALGIMSNIQGIAELDWTDAVGKFDYSRMLGLQDSENAKTLIDNLSNASALNNLGLLKGPMSDKDIAFLKSVSSKLDTVQSNSQFEKNIVEMYNIAARKAGVKEISKLSDMPKDRILPGQNTGTTQNSNTGAGQTVGGVADYTKYETP